jgi:hypothetical protein
MFETIMARAARRAEAHARARCLNLADRLAADLPRGLAAKPTDEGVLLSGRRARSRVALDPAIRAIIGGLLK